VNHCYLTFFR